MTRRPAVAADPADQTAPSPPSIAAATPAQIAATVKDLRDSRRLTVAQLANRANLPTSDVAMLEDGGGSVADLAVVLSALGYQIQIASNSGAVARGPVRGRSSRERLRDGRLSESLSLRLPVGLHDALTVHAAKLRRSSAAVLRDALADWLSLADPTDGSYFWPGTHERGADTVSYGGLRLTQESDHEVKAHAHHAQIPAGEVVRLAARNLLLSNAVVLPTAGCHIESDAATAARLRQRRSFLAQPVDLVRTAAADPATTGEALAAAAASIDGATLAAAAANPSTPPAALQRMSAHAVRRWQRATAPAGKKLVLYPDIGDLIFEWQDDHDPPSPSRVMDALASSQSTPGEALDPLTVCVRLHLELLWHPNATRWMLEMLSWCNSPFCEGEDSGGACERLAEIADSANRP